jgi:hypothetical protein
VAQWQAVTRLSGAASAPLTFQVILHEGGDVVLQYQSLAGPVESATVGMEDETGGDGLQLTGNAPALASGLSVRFARPAPAPRVKVYPTVFGAFAGPAQPARFEVPLRNAGDLAADTFDLAVSAVWPVSLLAQADHDNSLTDTDADTLPDTGPIAPGGHYTVTVLAHPPPGTPVGAFEALSLTVASSLDPGVSQTIWLEAARPAAVAQVLLRDTHGAGFLAVDQHAAAVEQPLPAAGRDLAIATAVDGRFLVAWRVERCNASCSAQISELHYVLLDHSGLALTSAISLTSHLTSTTAVLDLAPAAAGATSGPLGIAWRRVEHSNPSHSRENIYLALLDADGKLMAAPRNLTQHSIYGLADEAGVPRLGEPRLAVTRDNHFVIAWEQRLAAAGGGAVHDILYSIATAAGTPVSGPTAFTAGTLDGATVADPTVAALGDSQAVLAYNAGGSLAVGVLHSAGGVAQAETLLGPAGSRPDAVTLGPGRALLSWTAAGAVQAAVLGGTPLALASAPVALSHPQMTGGDLFVSAAADVAGRGILTWFDAAAGNFNLYYAVLDSDGAVLTPPLIWQRAPAALEVSRTGGGNSAYPATGLQRVWLPLLGR